MTNYYSGLPLMLCGAMILAACAGREVAPTAHQSQTPVLFSQGQEGNRLPPDWFAWIIHPAKKRTHYDMVSEIVEQADGSSRRQTVLRAQADSSASGLKHRIELNLDAQPLLRWQWKTVQLIQQADATSRYDDDSVLRIIVSFDGDKSKLSGKDRLFMEKAKLIAGQELPYATLMYIWENRQPVGQLIPNAYSSRIKKIVAQSGSEWLGRWHTLERNIVEDYQRAFGEAPGKILGIGVMTDTDNTQGQALSYYGDISFHALPHTP